MEPSKEPVSVRIARINSEITGKSGALKRCFLLSRESLLDAFQALYDECCSEGLQKYDSNIASFVEKYKNAVKQVKMLRVNLSDFEIKNIIGRGHFGEVHVVREKQTGYVYAMKTLRKFDNDTKRISFEEERNIMAYTASPWLTSLQYAFQDASNLFFVMEYHSGGDLLGLLYRQGGTLPESAALFYTAELVLALEDLHGMGYVHRDIKPDNVLLDRCGHLKLADFGSAAKVDKNGLVKMGPPVGTPDYIAPEVLQCLDNKNDKNSGYGISCDFWSLGVLAYELVIGNTPFQGQNSTSIYSKIMNYANTLKFPPDIVLSQAYVSFVKGLITDPKVRLNKDKIKNHVLFKNINFESLRDQVPPYVPKITSEDDTSNFTDVQVKKKYPSIENFKRKSQFSGRNLPFIGFTFTHDPSYNAEPNLQCRSIQRDDVVENLKSEVENLHLKLLKSGEFEHERKDFVQNLEEKSRRIDSLESLRDKLEKDLANNIAECRALKRTLELERKERSELEKRALDLIKSTKLKWELSEKNKVDSLNLEIEQLKEKISQLTNTNAILDEQLQRALNMEDKHRQSLEHVENLSRRSVMGLESRLEKVTSETQSTIADLQSKLNDEIHKTNTLHNTIIRMKEKELTLKDNLKASEEKYGHLQGKVEEEEVLIKQLSDKVNELEKENDLKDSYRKEIKELQQMLDDSQKTIKDLQNNNTMLQNETKKLENYRAEMEEMKERILKMQNDKRVSLLERELEEEKIKSHSLMKRLKEAESAVCESEELKEMKIKFWRMEKEFSNCKIDKRILERELKEAQDEVKRLASEIAKEDQKLSETKKCHEIAILELANINENLSMDLIKAKENIKNLEDQLDREKNKNSSEKTLISELNKTLNVKEQKIEQLVAEVNGVKKDRSVLEDRFRKEEQERFKLVGFIEDLQKEKSDLQAELDKCKRQVENSHLNLEALREACTLLESQVIEFERINLSHQRKESELNSNTEKLIGDLCQSKQETQLARQELNEQKSLRAVLEAKVKRLEEDVACLENECKSYKQQCMEYKQYSTGLSDELTVMEEKLSNCEVQLKAYERQMDKMSSENKHLKEEISDCITQISKLKDSNCKLNCQVNDFKDTQSGLVQKIKELERILAEKSHYFNERELKSEATIKQQTKLIDFLQSKIDDQSHKKKTLTEVIFGGSKKENQPPLSMAMNYKDLELQLAKERQNNQQLQEEIFKLKSATVAEINNRVVDKMTKVMRTKSEVLSPKNKDSINNVKSPSSQNNIMQKQKSLQRMHHNIPHRFESKLCTKSQNCAQCNNLISIGRSMNVCKECNLIVHVTCTSALPKTCGLPRAFADHYRESLQKLTEEEKINMEEKKLIEEANKEGWIKVPCVKSSSWEKRYIRLTKSSLDVYAQPPKDGGANPLESFPLNLDGSHGKVILEPLPSEIGIPVASSDLPFIIKVEVAPDTTCWPPRCFIFLTLSAKDKDMWFSALQKLFNVDQVKSKLETVAKIDDLSVNHVLDLTEHIKALGTEKGLYSHYENHLLYISGPSKVNQMAIFSQANLVLMIVEPKSILISCDLNHLINLTQCASCIKPALKFKTVNVNGLCGFHFLEVSKHSSQNKICVATSKQLIILEYYFDRNEFVPVRILDTAQPTSCVLFTKNSLIVGADKFFEIDLNSFQAEEFLDASDIQLRQAIKCYQMGSFPLSVIKISDNPKEYLLSFNEFSVFVDEYGRSSRPKEIKSSNLPLSFHIAKHYLYIIQFAAIEFVRINEETCNDLNDDSPATYKLQLNKFKYVGSNSRGIYIEQNQEIKFVEARKCVDYDTCSLISESTENSNDSDRFSFTSSMVQSLEGNLADSDAVDGCRKVRFDQTDL